MASPVHELCSGSHAEKDCKSIQCDFDNPCKLLFARIHLRLCIRGRRQVLWTGAGRSPGDLQDMSEYGMRAPNVTNDKIKDEEFAFPQIEQGYDTR